MLYLILALLGVALSAFFSGSEIAFITANPLQLEVWSKQKRRGARHARGLYSDPDGFLLRVLMGTTMANVFTTSFATAYLIALGWPPAAVFFAVTATLLLFGEVLPKTLSGERPNQFLRSVGLLHRWWRVISYPVTAPLMKLLNAVSPRTPVGPPVGFSRPVARGQAENGDTTEEITMAPNLALERDDLRILFEGRRHGAVLEKTQTELIGQVFDLGKTPVSRVMTPRTDIASVPADAELNQVIHTFIESGHSKLPVYRENLDTIIGVVYLYDLFKSPADLASITVPVAMIPESNTTMDVLKQLQRANRSIAVAVDEFGGTAGLVTVEDLFEELFGEFEDEFDPKASASRLADGSILAAGKTEVDDLNKRFQLHIPAGNYETLAGYIIDHQGRIPNAGEQIVLPVGRVIIKKCSARRIEQLQIYPRSGRRFG